MATRILSPKPPPNPGPTPTPNPIPVPSPPGKYGDETDPGTWGNFPDGLKLFFGLAITGLIAQALHHVNPTAGWLFAILVVLGYLAAGDAKTVGTFVAAIEKLVKP